MLKIVSIGKFLFIPKGSKHNGFTLVEVLAVIVILGLLAAVAVVSAGGLIEKAKKDVCNFRVFLKSRDDIKLI
ncbi:type II secretion system protein [Niallia oryzisoli]|uniref:type II secretion system protein n=1 Tax=Niallia oryzisoli TaxID=1737571 RepID=UPI0037369B6C